MMNLNFSKNVFFHLTQNSSLSMKNFKFLTQFDNEAPFFLSEESSLLILEVFYFIK